MDVWRERGSETEREKVRVEAEVEEMRQKKMLSEEEKRRCVHLIVNMVFKSPHQGWQILLNRFFISGVWKGWRRQPALCRVSR